MNVIKERRAIPENWTNGTIEYIYKNKGDAGYFGYYSSIYLTQIIYEIWSGLITRKISKIIHILTRRNRFRHKEEI